MYNIVVQLMHANLYLLSQQLLLRVEVFSAWPTKVMLPAVIEVVAADSVAAIVHSPLLLLRCCCRLACSCCRGLPMLMRLEIHFAHASWIQWLL
jgi:hypothetical protein